MKANVQACEASKIKHVADSRNLVANMQMLSQMDNLIKAEMVEYYKRLMEDSKLKGRYVCL